MLQHIIGVYHRYSIRYIAIYISFKNLKQFKDMVCLLIEFTFFIFGPINSATTSSFLILQQVIEANISSDTPHITS